MRLHVKNARLIDGTGGRPWTARACIVEGDTIAFAGRLGAADGPGPGEAEVVDVGGRTVIPGLIEAHLHLSYNNVKAYRRPRPEPSPGVFDPGVGEERGAGPFLRLHGGAVGGLGPRGRCGAQARHQRGTLPRAAAPRRRARHLRDRGHGRLEPVVSQARDGGPRPHRGRAGGVPGRRPPGHQGRGRRGQVLYRGRRPPAPHPDRRLHLHAAGGAGHPGRGPHARPSRLRPRARPAVEPGGGRGRGRLDRARDLRRRRDAPDHRRPRPVRCPGSATSTRSSRTGHGSASPRR